MILIISRIIRKFIAWILVVITSNQAQNWSMNVGSRIFNISLLSLINNDKTFQDMVNFLYIHLLWTMHLWEYCIHYTLNFNLRCIHYIPKDTIEYSLVFSNLISCILRLQWPQIYTWRLPKISVPNILQGLIDSTNNMLNAKCYKYIIGYSTKVFLELNHCSVPHWPIYVVR